MMIIAADDAIPYCREAFWGTGELRMFPGRKIRHVDIRDADALIVRSVTRVDASLLERSSVRFVGTATIGTDHLDEAYLKSRGIPFTNAAGSNANAVAEYVIAALLVVAQRKCWDLARKSIAIIGVGNVGSSVERKARALGMNVLLCDPPLRESTGNTKYIFLDDVIASDILTFHVPLTTTGPYPTFHMLNQAVLNRLSPTQFIINTSRGPVFDEPELKRALVTRSLEGAVLDVWEGEPRIDYTLLDMVEIGSPHIAGYSLDGKVRATEMILEEMCRIFGIPASWDTGSIFPPARMIRPTIGSRGQDAICSVVNQAYDILRDDAEMRSLKALSEEEAKREFDRLRNNYSLRPEFRHCIVELAPEQAELAASFRDLGFQTQFPGNTARGNS